MDGLRWVSITGVIYFYCRSKTHFFNYRGLYFGPKTIPIYIPPPPWKWYFSPSCDTSFFDSHHGLSALILPNFAFILPFYFPFSHFLSLSCFFFPLSSCFFSLSSFFFYIFPLFLFPFSYFPKWHRLIFPPGVFSNIDPCSAKKKVSIFSVIQWVKS